MVKLLQNQVCIITGAGKGIGRAMAESFLEHGAKLALITRSEEDIKSLNYELNLPNENLLTYCGDVSVESTVNDFVFLVLKKYGKIDVLVNNAGIRFRKPFLETTPQEFKNIFEINVGSMFLFMQAVIPHMLKHNQGKVINMSSVAGTLGLPELSSYVTSKSAIVGLTKSTALEFAENNIQINAIAAGFCKTSYFENFKKKSDLYDFTLNRTPMRRWGESKEIANACLFLASNLSDYVTGEVLNVDGGWSSW